VAKLAELPSRKRSRPVIWTDDRTKAFWEEYERRVQAARAEGRRVKGLETWLSTPHPKVSVWTPAQTAQFLERAAGHRLYALYHLVTFFGLRRGEACGLPRAEIDRKNKTIYIDNELVTVGWEVHEDDPKSDAGDRTLFLDDVTAEVIDAHLRRQDAERREWCDAWVESGYAFTKENGKPLHPAWVSDEFHRLAFEADLPPIRFHDLRHGTATHALSAGVAMKVVQEILGHADESVTSGTYTSVADELKRDAANAIAGLIQAAKDAARAEDVLPDSQSDSHGSGNDAGSPS
jgi:integrase